MATQPTGTVGSPQSTLAPAAANGVVAEQAQPTQTGIADTGQSTIAPVGQGTTAETRPGRATRFFQGIAGAFRWAWGLLNHNIEVPVDIKETVTDETEQQQQQLAAAAPAEITQQPQQLEKQPAPVEFKQSGPPVITPMAPNGDPARAQEPVVMPEPIPLAEALPDAASLQYDVAAQPRPQPEAQAAVGIANNGQPTPDRLLTSLDPRMGATDGPLGSYGLLGQGGEVPLPGASSAHADPHLLSPLSISGLSVILFAFADERSDLPLPPVEQRIGQMSEAEKRLLALMRKRSKVEMNL